MANVAARDTVSEWPLKLIASLKDIAEQLNISKERVRQLECAAISKIIRGIKNDTILRQMWQEGLDK